MERSADHAVGIHGRAAELARIGRFLDAAADQPAALLIEGEAGIGKTTLWSAGIDQARQRGWQVLTCRPVQPEAALSFSALGDLLEPVPEAALSGLPGPQRRALDVALPGSPHTVAGPLHTVSPPAHSAFADTWAP